MKKVLFGIALILFALLLKMSDIWLPGVSDLISQGEFAVLVGLAGLIVAGIGAFKKDE